jgi:hypothetical protein
MPNSGTSPLPFPFSIRAASANMAVGLMKQQFMVHCTPRIKPQYPFGTVFLPREIEDE